MDSVTLSLLIKAVDEASSVMQGISGNVTTLGTKAEEASQKTGLLGQAFDSLKQGFVVGVGIAAAQDAINGLSEAIPHAIEEISTFGQEVLKMTRETGASAETSSALLAVFERYGVSSDQASRSLGLFAKNLNTYADSSQAAQSKSTGFAGAIDGLGLKVKDAQGVLIPMSEQLLNVADKFKNMPDGIEKTADAVALFGRSGKDMILVLNQGREGLQEAEDAAAKYGLVLTGDNIEAVRNFGLAHKDLDEAMKGVSLQVGVALLPLLAKLAEGAAGLAQAFNQTVLPVFKEFGVAIDSFTSSEAFQTWAARLLVVVGLISDGVGVLAGVFFTALGGILDVVNTVGQAIYEGLQWLNPFAAHSPPLVSQVQDGVAAIEAAYGGLSGITSTFDGIAAAFENLGATTDTFANTVDDVSTRTEKALSVMGPDVTAAFNEATAAVDTAKASLGDIKSAWDDATGALGPLKANLDAFKDALKDQQTSLADLKSSLADAQSAYDPLNNALKDAKQNAMDASNAIKALTSTPIAGTAEFDSKISDANIALKQQALALNVVKNSDSYTGLGSQIDAATAKLKEMQRSQAAAPNVVAGSSATQRAGITDAANAARAAIAQQQAALDDLKTKQSDLLAPAQKKLDLDRSALDTINLQKDATIGVAAEQIKQAGLTAQGIKEQTQAQIEAGLAAAGAAKTAAESSVSSLTPQVAGQLANIDALKAKIQEQQHAVDDAKASTDAANTTYTDAKTKVDDLGKAYRDTKAEIASYEQQLKSTIATGDTQVQKIAAAAQAAKTAAKTAASAAGGSTDSTSGDSLADNLNAAKKKAEEFSNAIDQARRDITDFFRPVTDAAAALQKFVAPLSGVGQFLSSAALAFVAFNLAAGPAWGILVKFVEPVASLAPKLALLLSPIGLVALAIAALGVAIATNFGGIRDMLQPFIDALSGLADDIRPILSNFTLVFQKALNGDLGGALEMFVARIRDVADRIIPFIARWGGAFLTWTIGLVPKLIGGLGSVLTAMLGWIAANAQPIGTAVLSWAAAFLGWQVSVITSVVGALGPIIVAIVSWIGAQAGTLVTNLAVWGAAFAGWVGMHIQPMLDSLEILKIRLLSWIGEQKDKLAVRINEWGAAFVGWTKGHIQPMLDSLGELKDKLFVWIGDRKTDLWNKLQEWGGAFVGWAGDHVQPMLDSLGNLKDKLFAWIGEQKTKLWDKLKEWGLAFVGWAGEHVQPMLDKLGEVKDKVLNWIGDQKNKIGDKLGEWKDEFLNWANITKQDLSDKLQKVIDIIKEWVAENGPAVDDQGKVVGGKFIDGIVKGLGGLKDSVGKAIHDQLKDVSPDLADLADKLGPKISEPIDSLVRNLQTLVTWFKNFRDELEKRGVVDDLKTSWDNLKDAGKLLGDILEPLGTSLGNLVKWFQSLYPEVDKTNTALSGDSGSTDQSAKAAASGIKGLTSDIKQFTSDLKTVLQWIKDVGIGLDEMDRAAGKAQVATHDFIKGVLDGIAGGAADFIAAGASVITGLIEGIGSGFDKLGTAVQDDIVTPLINSVKSLLGIASPSTVFADIGGEVIDGLVSGLEAKVQSITDWLGGVFGPNGRIVQAIPDAGKLLMSTGTDILLGLKDGLDAAWTASGGVWEWLNALPGKIWSTLADSKPGLALVSIGTDLLGGLRDGLSAAWSTADGVWAWLNGLIGKIWQTLADMKPGEALVSIGTDLMGGLLDGLKSKWTDIETWFKGLKFPDLPSIQLPSFAGGGAIGAQAAGGGMPPPGELTDTISQIAKKYGIDPSVALRVANSEGGSSPGAVGDQGSSFGPFQLHMGGLAPKGSGNEGSGLGDSFKAATGLDARDITSTIAQIDYALSVAAKQGWAAWHGAARAGISDFQGIGVAAATAVTNIDQVPDAAPSNVPTGSDSLTNPMHSAMIPGGTSNWDMSAASVGAKALDGADAAIQKATPDLAVLSRSVQDFNMVGGRMPAVLNAAGKSMGGLTGAASGAGAAISAGLGGAIFDAQRFADQTGISIDAANKILMDHGNVAKEVLGTGIPGQYQLTTSAVTRFADAFKLTWDQAHELLTTGGDVSMAVMGGTIPKAAQATIDAVTAAGDRGMWQRITANAETAGQGLVQYLQITGAGAIDAATASLGDLEKASGLSLPQIQVMAQAAGQDIDTWLRKTGVPATQALALALAGPDGVDKQALLAAGGLTTATGAAAGFASTLILTGNPAIDSFNLALSKIPAAAQAASASYASLVEQMDRNQASSGPGGSLRQAASVAADIGVHSATDSSGNTYTISKPYAAMSQGEKADANRFGNANPSGLARALGGPVSAGRKYLVGEMGPELFVPNSIVQMAKDMLLHPSLKSTLAGMPYPIGEDGKAMFTPPSAGFIVPAGAYKASTKMLDPSALRRLAPRALSDAVMAMYADSLKISDQDRGELGLERRAYGGPVNKDQSYIVGEHRPEVFTPRQSGSIAPSVQSIDYDKLAQAMTRAMANAPAPRVAVEDIRSGLLRVGARNAGQVGLA